MCIQVNRWFICPLLTPPNGQPLPTSEPPLDPRRPRYERDTPVPHDELSSLNLPEFDNFTYVRHQDQLWIRCAMASVISCIQQPQQIRTELYTIPCPICTRDDKCILSRPPFRIDYEELVLTSFRQGTRIASVDAYFEELLAVVEAYVDVELDDLPLSERSFAVYYTGMCCTQDTAHVLNESIYGSHTEECDETECYNISKPWSHNLSRAARIQDGKMLRSGRAFNWFNLAENPQALNIEAWKSDQFADIPNQSWFALTEEDVKVRYNRMVGQLAEHLMKLVIIGPTVQTWSGPTPNENDWKEILAKRENLALLFIWYGAVDPGLSAPFLDFLMRHHILSILNPFLNKESAPERWKFLDCHDPATESVQLLVERFSNLLRDPQKVAQVTRARNRREVMREILEHNRNVDYRNKNTLQRLVDGSAILHALPGSGVINALPECVICADKFLDQADIPRHMHTTLTPCCKQAFHFRCFKGFAAFSGKCPYCRQVLDQRLLHGGLSYSAALEGRPRQLGVGGLISTPNTHEIQMLERRRDGHEISFNEHDSVEPLFFVGPEDEPWDIPIPNVDEVVEADLGPSLNSTSDPDFNNGEYPENSNINEVVEAEPGSFNYYAFLNFDSGDPSENLNDEDRPNTIGDNGDHANEDDGDNTVEDGDSNTFEDRGDTRVEDRDDTIIEDNGDNVIGDHDDTFMEDHDDSQLEDIDDNFMEDSDDLPMKDSHGSDDDYIPTSSDEDDDYD